MATAYGPSIVRDGLVLCMDAANPKSLLTSAEVLVVAGGGAGGGYHGGGGGGGGVIYNSSFSVTAGTSYTVTVGAGGTAATSVSGTGDPGSNSVFGSLTAIGGGAGHSQGAVNSGARNNGGSGGGASDGGAGVLHSGGTGTAGQGFGGGSIFGDGPSQIISYATAGGGGAGGAGTGPVSTSGGAGGPGLPFNISGSLQYYGGGGGGTQLGTGTGSAPVATYGLGGIGGGGNGGYTGSAGGAAIRSSVSGVAGTGGGGGGYLYSSLGGGAGGSGIVIVRYAGSQRATGGTVTSVGGYTIHTFTTVGSTTFTPTTWSDVSGNANSGTLTDGPTYSSANGGYIAFNGTSNYITNSTNLFSGRTTTTGAYWVYITAYPSGNVGVLHMWNGVSQLAYDTTSGGIPQFWINGALIVSGNQLSLNTWHYMTWVTDGAFARIYTNGVLVNSGAFTAAIATSAQPMYIFRRSDSATYMAGRLSSLSVYNRALSAAEIQQNFNAHRGRYGI